MFSFFELLKNRFLVFWYSSDVFIMHMHMMNRCRGERGERASMRRIRKDSEGKEGKLGCGGGTVGERANWELGIVLEDVLYGWMDRKNLWGGGNGNLYMFF